jgi:phage terminase large subunit-like protein
MPSRTDPVTAYAKKVVGGKVPCGRLHRLSCVRHLRDLKEQKERGLYWDRAAAVRAIGFFGHLRHYKGEWAGQPMVLRDWQQYLIGSIFGWKQALDHDVRRFRTAFNEFCRGQGKSTMAAGVALYGTFFDNEPGNEGYCVSTKRDQSKIVHETARRMVLASPALKKRLSVQQHNIHQLLTASKLEPLGADADTLDGLRPGIVIADEVHAHKTSAVLDVMQTGMGTRRQPLMFEITTAGVGQEGVWYAHREYSAKILENIIDDETWFAFIACADSAHVESYQFVDALKQLVSSCTCHVRDQIRHPAIQTGSVSSEILKAAYDEHSPTCNARKHRLNGSALLVDVPEDDWKLESTHRKANPNYGYSVKPGYLASECKKAQEMPMFQNAFRRLHCGQPTEQLDRALDMDAWDACKVSIDWSEYAKRDAYLGLDLANTTDIAAALWLFPEDDGSLTILPRFWVPEEGVQRRSDRDRVPYNVWADPNHGYITATPGNVIDYEAIRRDLNEDGDQFVLKEAGFDPWNATQLATQLTGDGFTMVQVRQGYKTMSEPTKHLLTLITSKKLRHDGNPVLRWMASNLVLRQDPVGNVAPDKSKATEKIDGIVALIIGLSRLIVQPADEGGSVYESRGILAL